MAPVSVVGGVAGPDIADRIRRRRSRSRSDSRWTFGDRCRTDPRRLRRSLHRRSDRRDRRWRGSDSPSRVARRSEPHLPSSAGCQRHHQYPRRCRRRYSVSAGQMSHRHPPARRSRRRFAETLEIAGQLSTSPQMPSVATSLFGPAGHASQASPRPSASPSDWRSVRIARQLSTDRRTRRRHRCLPDRWVVRGRTDIADVAERRLSRS